ncbi:hypothetical protein [Methylobacterium oxalidis]|uniref:hypothetical protein n=1 Tax=Methylobacterium oxalidis TaxID=944322 RepID=UPI0033148E8E
MLPILVPILGFAIQHAPALISLLAGDKAGEVAEGAVKAVRDVLGTTDLAEAQAKISADPALGEALAARLNTEAERYKAELADTANARAMQVSLAQAGHWTSSTPAIISYLIIGSAILLTVALFFVQTEIPERLYNLLSGAYGALWLAVGLVTQFWLGSNRSSQRKDDTITNLSTAAAKR